MTETQLLLLAGLSRNPLAGEAPGRSYSQFQTLDQRVAARTRRLVPSLTPRALAGTVAAIARGKSGRSRAK